jgi:hypothetical protein
MLIAALPPPDEIRRKAAEVLQRPEYHENTPSGSGELARTILLRVFRWLGDAFEWLADSLRFLPDSWRYPAAILLCVLLAAFVIRIIYAIGKAARLPDRVHAPRERRQRAHSAEELEALAEEEYFRGRVLEAVRLLFRASVRRLEDAEKRVNRPGTTNRELLRRYRSMPLYEPLRTMVDTIDVKWYGGRAVAPQDYDLCAAAHRRVRQLISATSPPPEAAATNSTVNGAASAAT